MSLPVVPETKETFLVVVVGVTSWAFGWLDKSPVVSEGALESSVPGSPLRMP